ncbi:hypothetical protein TH63_13505 [Rufibacter radiotolerans]|uniref:Uncharacterized protein n=1 Tax=Rufibacter radiotolerans TaxID=1379910 RepID=A0A0H4VRK3_9BACT|nr:DEAD/DEAH box helicase family protein [Rufibacter radiotolerans]AKQ46409.1 hypothetical protein TH63_13505 [Rufibacter radiotolerans]
MNLRIDLEKLRKETPHYTSGKNPREHQKDAFQKMSELFTFKNGEHKAGILVLPTGAGKTFTAVRWICKNVLPKNAKVLWLAHTGHLLDQAFETFKENLLEIPPTRNTVNIRVVSSASEHSKAANIKETDDVLIITTQTAISNTNVDALDGNGEKRKTAFEKFIESSKGERLFVVLDEAHHAPAYGCRNLLIGGNEAKEGLRQLVPNSYFLGLTATPSYSDARRRGWLWEIFKDKIIFEAKKGELIKQNILAVPNYIQRNTGEEFEVSDQQYNALVREHKELPEDIIEKLARDSVRNDYIVEEYLSGEYGKTIIFADRWFQCVYIKEKLMQKAKERGLNLRVDAVFSTSHSGGSVEERNRRTSEENTRILKQFKGNELDVLLNVKMLTEGTDVPDVISVFITRQTTSNILLTQMVGRGLRGKGAGGGMSKEVANIVFFVDNWKRVINFAIPENGGTESSEPKVRGSYPIEFISIKLIEELSRKIESGLVFSNKPFLESIPVGWYETEILVTVEDSTEYFREYVIVFESTRPKFEQFISYAKENLSVEWEKDNLDEDYAQHQAEEWVTKFFSEEDNSTNTLDLDLIKIARHLAQAKAIPAFFSFAERDSHDLSRIARELLQFNEFDVQDKLFSIYHDSAFMWGTFYRSYDRFKTAFDAERNRIYHIHRFGSEPAAAPVSHGEENNGYRELSEAEKKQVFLRDNHTCQACGKQKDKGRKVKFQVDHIVPFKFGGETSISNSQTLCSICNGLKGVNEINFKVYRTPLKAPKDLKPLLKPTTSSAEMIDEVLRRTLNTFYHCQAVSDIICDVRPRSKHRYHWIVELYEGNNPEWLNAHKEALVSFVQKELGYPELKELEIR